MKRIINFYFFALAVSGNGISGGDRIFIEFARRWSKKYHLKVFTSFEGARLCKKQDLKGGYFKILSLGNKVFESIFLLNYLYKIFAGIKLGFTLKLENTPENFVYSASEFWMDSLPALIIKLRYPRVIWVAAWYQTAPNPFKGYAEGNREKKYKFSALLYWLSQLPVKPLIANFASYVLVNNDNEKKQFHNLDIKKRVIIVLGAVDLEKIGKWQKDHGNFSKTYDAVFQGRFHPQKGVVELIDVWRKVVDKKSNAKLAMIGDGPLMEKVKSQIAKYNLQKNIELFGYVFDGDKKYRIFAQSKIVVHPAFYDSGGMASAEAMAFGLPCVGFNLKSYISYYPKGMIKVKIGNLRAFANVVLDLLADYKYRSRIGIEAFEMIKKNWSWDKRASGILDKLLSKDIHVG